MDESCLNDTNNEVIIVIEGVMSGLGAITCTVALVFAIVSRFYKDIVQRLIVYKLVTMLVFSLSESMFLGYDDSRIYRAVTVYIPHTAYYINVGINFWLTITLYLCIVYLKKLKNFKKLEIIAIITSFLPVVSVVLIPFTYIDCSHHKLIINFPKTTKNPNNLILYIIGYGTVGILYFIMSVLIVIIFIVTIRRSRQHLQRQEDSEAEYLLVTNNKWKILSKQLLPLVVYPIVNTVMAMVFFPLIVLYFNGNTFPGVYLYSLISSSGLITGIIVIIHLCILKCKKKQRKKEYERQQEAFCVVPCNHNDVFTRETVASTNARTTYQFTRTSSFMVN